MKIAKTITFLTLLLITLSFTCCQERENRQQLDVGNAVYYWRTDLQLDSTERAFLEQYQIQKLYCRYFDVVMNDAGEPQPNATISFSDTLSEGIEMIPTVYITEDCMHKKHDGMADKIVKRILQMNETNDIMGIKEIQIDCDFTNRSRKVYYEFLDEIRRLAKDFRVSTTIRLHQLSMKAPDVDYGVLMIYNTGDPRNFMERNPILDYRDVYPYLEQLDKYPLPLAAAYPVYQWVRNIKGVRVEHTVEADEIRRVKKEMEAQRPDLSRAIITYHLDKDNINRYKPQIYEEIYHH